MTSDTIAAPRAMLAWKHATPSEVPMFRKVLIGMFAVAIGLAVAGAGYRFGQYLAQKDAPVEARAATAA
ncbi:MAG: hypothetical protein C0521_05030 [Xanthomonas sp.]|nr:hypothetical protein [Xanthomonas sp.]